VLLAAGLMLVRMSRDGELLALKSCGVSLRRLMLPVFLCALPIAAGVFWVQERVAPWAMREQQLLNHKLSRDVGSQFLLRDQEHGLHVFVGGYDFSTGSMSQLCVVRIRPDGRPERIIEADSGEWMTDGDIVLQKVSVQEFDRDGNPDGKPETAPTRRLETSLVPYDFVRAKRDVMSTRVLTLTLHQLRQKIKQDPGNDHFRLMLHSRLAAPFVTFALLLVGIPVLVGFERSTNSRVLGGIVCVLIVAAFHVVSFVVASMGNVGLLDPAVAAWLPHGLAAGAGIWLFATMHT
jgi:lipopolysaccharide export LptBFGC system permease protein LptF